MINPNEITNKKFGIFIDRIFIGHARDIIADGPLHAAKGKLGQKILR